MKVDRKLMNASRRISKEDRPTLRKIIGLSRDRKDALYFCRAYETNPEVFKEVLTTAEHNGSIVDAEHFKRHVDVQCNGKISKSYARKMMLYAISGAIGTVGGLSSALFFNGIGRFAGGLFGVSIGAISYYQLFSPISKRFALNEEYLFAKSHADNNLGYRRVRGSPQLEFLFMDENLEEGR
ncbi:hypothetical protein KJ652_00865 [Patescibacteria group bacterium]|nr:hypothetical protein [Patescibacteria group bacterium]